ncbi:MAG: hypothetical protein Q9M43_05740 [Sulfurimonas sp.]|nr:hypothetical protein [Sulfurimonas sp.]
MEVLVDLLKNTKGKITITAAEAIMLVEIFGSKITVSSNGELVISVGVANKFALDIYNDPMRFITYIKAVEEKVNLDYVNNQIDLGEVLYMLRNARKFGLELDEQEDSDLIVTIKSTIYKSDLKDVLINIVGDENEENYFSTKTEDVLINTYKEETQESQKEKQEAEDEKAQKKVLEKNPNLKSIVRLENGHIFITFKDDTTMEKDDLRIYSLTKPQEEDNTKQKTSGGSNNIVEIVNETVGKMLNTETQNSQNANTKLTPLQKREKIIKEYVHQYGELCYYEEKYKNEMNFKDRAREMLVDEHLFCDRHFSSDIFDTDNFFNSKDMFKLFLASLFKAINAIGKDRDRSLCFYRRN